MDVSLHRKARGGQHAHPRLHVFVGKAEAARELQPLGDAALALLLRAPGPDLDDGPLGKAPLEDGQASGDARQVLAPAPAATNRRAPLDVTAWGRLVKATFKAYGDVALCPKDCRASFVTWLRSGEHGDDVLTSAARQMRHSSQMSESATYDKEKAARVVSAASKAADAFALRFA